MNPPPCDVIVTGAGIAGMMTACFLAQAGRRVIVLEANHQAGGLMAGIRRKGYYFDVGDQSFENLGIVFPLLDQLGLYDASQWERSRYQIHMPDLDVVVESLPQTEAAFCRAFAAQAPEIRRVFATHGRTSALLRDLTGRGELPGIAGNTPLSLARLVATLAPHAPWLLGMLREDFAAWYRRKMPPSRLRDLLSRCGYSNMNVFIASAFWHLWAEDYWYPRGGLQSLFDRLRDNLIAHGGELRTRERVSRYLIDDGEVRGVETRKGERLWAPRVVHTGDLRSAVFDLIGEEHFSARFLRRMRQAELSDAMVSVYLGLDLPPEVLRGTLRAQHLFYFPSYDAGRACDLEDPDYHSAAFFEVTAHSLFQPDLAPAGKSALVVQCFSDMRWLGGWGARADGEGRKRHYRELKARVGAQIVERLEPLIPGIAQHIEWLDVGTPRATVRFTGNAQGATAGHAMNLRSWPFFPKLGSFDTPVRNLHWAGHYTLWPGSVPMAALSGKLVAQRILTQTR